MISIFGHVTMSKRHVIDGHLGDDDFFLSFETIPNKSWSHFREIESFASFSAKFYNFKTSNDPKKSPPPVRFFYGLKRPLKG